MMTDLSVKELEKLREDARAASRARVPFILQSPHVMLDMIQYVFNLRRLANGRIDWKAEKMWFEDNNGKKITVGHLGLCEQCSEVDCRCDADEDGFYMCANHLLHPAVGNTNAVQCTMARLRKKFPDADPTIIFDIISDAEAWTFEEAVAIIEIDPEAIAAEAIATREEE